MHIVFIVKYIFVYAWQICEYSQNFIDKFLLSTNCDINSIVMVRYL